MLTQEDVKELFEYRDGDLYWKIDIYAGKNKEFCKVKVGDKAGSVHISRHYKTSYKQVVYQKRNYKVARIIFLMFYGYWPRNVTYKDKDTLNTRIENLIEANSSELQCRSRKASNNKTGNKGINFDKRAKKYRCQIVFNNKKTYLGLYDTVEEASKVYEEAKEKYHGKFLSKCVS
jgi:hypothetical protein